MWNCGVPNRSPGLVAFSTGRLCLALIVLTLPASGTLLAQNRVRTETIRPPAAVSAPPVEFKADPHIAPESPPATAADVSNDLSLLPPAVARTRERIVAAARSGDLQKLVTVMQQIETMPVFSFAEDKDPIAFWNANYPESAGVELLSILTTILETGFVHVDRGTPQEIYLWPYFARMPLDALTPEQKVELFRIVTGADYKDMIEFGAYSFYRVGIAPDGVWQFFVSGD
jgi:hypothetical protein